MGQSMTPEESSELMVSICAANDRLDDLEGLSRTLADDDGDGPFSAQINRLRATISTALLPGLRIQRTGPMIRKNGEKIEPDYDNMQRELAAFHSDYEALLADAADHRDLHHFFEQYPEAFKHKASMSEALGNGSVQHGATLIDTLGRAYDFVRGKLKAALHSTAK